MRGYLRSVIALGINEAMPDRERAAFIQAGHAVGAHVCGLRVQRVSIIPIEDADSWIDVEEPVLPDTGLLTDPGDRLDASSLIVALLAGPAVGQRYSFGLCGADMSSCRDLLMNRCVWRAANLARRLGSGGSNLHLLWQEAALIADEHETWSAAEAVARLLMNAGEVTGQGIDRVMENELACLDDIPNT